MAIQGLSRDNKALLEMGKAVGFTPTDGVTGFEVTLGTPDYTDGLGLSWSIPATVIIKMTMTDELYATIRKLMSEVGE